MRPPHCPKLGAHACEPPPPPPNRPPYESCPMVSGWHPKSSGSSTEQLVETHASANSSIAPNSARRRREGDAPCSLRRCALIARMQRLSNAPTRPPSAASVTTHSAMPSSREHAAPDPRSNLRWKTWAVARASPVAPEDPPPPPLVLEESLASTRPKSSSRTTIQWEVQSATTAAAKVRQSSDSEKCDAASSATKSVPEIGAMNAAATPAPAPMATKSRWSRSLRSARKEPSRREVGARRAPHAPR